MKENLYKFVFDKGSSKNALVALSGKPIANYRNDANWQALINRPTTIAIAILKDATTFTRTPAKFFINGNTVSMNINYVFYDGKLYIYNSKTSQLMHVIVPRHAYSVFRSFRMRPVNNPRGVINEYVVIRNPWNSNTLTDGQNRSISYSNGIMDFEMSLFTHLFTVHYIT
jgi:hypothetical protein